MPPSYALQAARKGPHRPAYTGCYGNLFSLRPHRRLLGRGRQNHLDRHIAVGRQRRRHCPGRPQPTAPAATQSHLDGRRLCHRAARRAHLCGGQAAATAVFRAGRRHLAAVDWRGPAQRRSTARRSHCPIRQQQHAHRHPHHRAGRLGDEPGQRAGRRRQRGRQLRAADVWPGR